jgi:hypothetical protein
MTVVISSAVIAECEQCGERSNPMDPGTVTEWQKCHEDRHSREARRERMVEHGHTANWVMEYMDCDDSSAHAFCSCGWKSRSAKHCWMLDFINTHLREVEAQSKRVLTPSC